MRNLIWIGCCVCFCLAPLAQAADTNSVLASEFASDTAFRSGGFEAAFNNGVMFSPFIATGGRPTINYTMTEIQLGYMLGTPHGDSWWRGNFELVGEGFGSAIFQGPGSWIAGMTIWGRYNFVPRDCHWAPYAQVGLGLTSTDIDHNIVGQPFNFNIDVGVGVRYLFSTRWAMSLEYRYQHISNANSGKHNLGINANGPILGISYLF